MAIKHKLILVLLVLGIYLIYNGQISHKGDSVAYHPPFMAVVNGTFSGTLKVECSLDKLNLTWAYVYVDYTPGWQGPVTRTYTITHPGVVTVPENGCYTVRFRAVAWYSGVATFNFYRQ